jgi:type II secretory pathway pseudopilin PulG
MQRKDHFAFRVSRFTSPFSGFRLATPSAWFHPSSLPLSPRHSTPDTRHPPPSSLSSFTLIEVLVTLVILATGIVIVLRAFDTSLVALGESRDSLRAGALLRQKLEEVEQRVLAEGEEGLGSASGSSDGYDDWRVRVQADLHAVSSGASRSTNKLYRVAALAWRDGMDRRYGAATYVRVAE